MFDFERFDVFVNDEEASVESLVAVTEEEALLGADGVMLWYGAAGSGKTTLEIDFGVHAAAGVPWLGMFPFSRPLRVAIIENEGSRAQFRQKLRRKQATWNGPPFAESLYVYTGPWAEFSFADEQCREDLAAFVDSHEIDAVLAGPLVELGAGGAGTPDDVTEFGGFVKDWQRRVGRAVALLLIHHENKGGRISGAWDRLPQTMVRVGNGDRHRTTVYIEKARHSSRAHGSSLVLGWVTDCDGYEVKEKDFGEEPDTRAEQRAACLAWCAAYVEKECPQPGDLMMPVDPVAKAYHRAHGNSGEKFCRDLLNSSVLAAGDPSVAIDPGGKLRAAVNPGGKRPGVYLYPSSHALPPAADPLPAATAASARDGDEPDLPPAAAAYREGGGRREVGETPRPEHTRQ